MTISVAMDHVNCLIMFLSDNKFKKNHDDFFFLVVIQFSVKNKAIYDIMTADRYTHGRADMHTNPEKDGRTEI